MRKPPNAWFVVQISADQPPGTKPTPVQGSKMPELTLSLPLALGLLALFVTIGAAAVFFTLRSTGRVVEPTPVPSPTNTPTLTLTPTATETATPQPTFTPIPPIEYTIAEGDSCLSIALTFDVSFQSIILLNNLPAACNTPGRWSETPGSTTHSNPHLCSICHPECRGCHRSCL